MTSAFKKGGLPLTRVLSYYPQYKLKMYNACSCILNDGTLYISDLFRLAHAQNNRLK